MWTTFCYTVKSVSRNKQVLLWALAFPVILTTIFFMLFNNIDEAYEFEPIGVVVVDDANYRAADALPELVETLSEGEDAVLAPTYVGTAQEATDMVASKNNDTYYGYIDVDADGNPRLHVTPGAYDVGYNPQPSIIRGILGQYVQHRDLLTEIAATNPEILADQGFLDQVFETPTFTEEVAVTANPPSDSLRYMYSALAFSSLMMSSFAQMGISRCQPRASQIGARRSFTAQSPVTALSATFLATWLVSFLVLLAAFCLVRFGFGVSFGGKEALCVVGLVVSSLVANVFGSLIGALPLPEGAKGGISSGFITTLSLFAGLYGPGSQQLADQVAQNAPWTQLYNPVKQTYNMFMSLYAYDDASRFTEIIVQLVGLSAVLFAVTALIVRRRSYASL